VDVDDDFIHQYHNVVHLLLNIDIFYRLFSYTYQNMTTKTTTYQSENGNKNGIRPPYPAVRVKVHPIESGYQTECDDKGRYVRMNVLNSWDTDFEKVPCISQSARDVCNKVAFVSQDPRLVSSAHSGQRLALDNIPLNGKVQIWDTPYIAGYKAASYDSFSDIHGGQNTYYYNKDLAVPFISELFIQPGLVVKEDYVDPMDSYKPHYCRASMDNKNCLSWIRDSQFHREDLMSKQIWNRNQTNYEVDVESRRVLM